MVIKLDNMRAKVVAITQPLLSDSLVRTAEDLIVYCARVSNPSNQENMETAPKLLAYLIKNKHWSPFDMVDLVIEIQTSRAIAAQILRHWSFRFQEFSQRYATATAIEPVSIRKAGATNRQSSEEEFNPLVQVKHNMAHFPTKKGYAQDLVNDYLAYGQALYQSLIDDNAGVAKVVAWMVLPLTTQTTLYMKGSVRSWIFYFLQRLSSHAQLEHRLLAKEASELFKVYFPSVSQAIGLIESDDDFDFIVH